MFLTFLCYNVVEILNKERKYVISPKSSVCFENMANKSSILYIESTNDSSLWLSFDENKHDNIKAAPYLKIRNVIPGKTNKFCIGNNEDKETTLSLKIDANDTENDGREALSNSSKDVQDGLIIAIIVYACICGALIIGNIGICIADPDRWDYVSCDPPSVSYDPVLYYYNPCWISPHWGPHCCCVCNPSDCDRAGGNGNDEAKAICFLIFVLLILIFFAFFLAWIMWCMLEPSCVKRRESAEDEEALTA